MEEIFQIDASFFQSTPPPTATSVKLARAITRAMLLASGRLAARSIKVAGTE